VPTIFRSGPYRFFFYSADANEPPHVHVERRGEKPAKFWLAPVRLERGGDFGSVEIGRVEELVRDNQTLLLNKWHEFFGDEIQGGIGPER
jgi:Domain of unknown function (DUF4160)